MEIIVGIGFLSIVAFFAVRKFRKVSENKDCCK
jgi:hypothetical protein